MKHINFTRRDFLKTSTAAAGGALLGTLALERSVHAANDDSLKIALVGCGGRGSGAAVQAMNADSNCKLVAMADAFRDRLDSAHEQIKKKHESRVDVPEDHKFVGFDAFKHAIDLADVVILTSPPGFRPAHFEEAVRKGKHIFMEKPVAVDAVGVRKVLAAAQEAKKKNLKVGVGLQRHHQPNYIQTVKRLQDGAIGNIVAARVYWNGGPVGPKYRRAKVAEILGRQPTEMEFQMRNWYMFNWLCGDHIVEQHIHNMDVVNWIKNDYPIRASGMGGRAFQKGPDSGEIYDHHAVEYEFADGTRMFSQCRQIPGCENNVSEHVIGTKGLCNVSGHRITGEKNWRYQAQEGDSNDGWQLEHYSLFEAIRNDREFNEAENGAKSTLTAIMGRMATYS
ncbi:MAG: Gfo/Idh/MocA family oxidoreductase, partial [Limisphaerales bacterium]